MPNTQAPAARMTAERLAEIRGDAQPGRRRIQYDEAYWKEALRELLRELDAVTKEREKVTEQLEGAKRHTTRVESIARERAVCRDALLRVSARGNITASLDVSDIATALWLCGYPDEDRLTTEARDG